MDFKFYWGYLMPFRKKTFKETNAEAFYKELVRKLKDCTVQMYHPQFIFFEPNNLELVQQKNLKSNYNREKRIDYSFSTDLRAMRSDDAVKNQARKKLQNNDIIPVQKYDNDDASLKMHISLNNIGDMDHKLIVELLTLLRNEAADPNNKLGFKFKIVRPLLLNDPINVERFGMNDQITVYFDKYSSTGAMINLANKVDDFLKKHSVPENKQKTGLKDKISINSFVSLRFDNNKLDQVYGEYPFFDLEIQKFLARHQSSELASFPMFAFEKIFIDLMLSQSINNLRSGPNDEQALSEEDSQKLQQRFDTALKDPSSNLKQNREKDADPKAFTAQNQNVAYNTPPNIEMKVATPTDVRVDPLLKILPSMPKVPSNSKVAETITRLKAESDNSDGEVRTILNAVLSELESLSKNGLSTDQDNRAQQILKNGLNKAISSPGGFGAVIILEKIMQRPSAPNVPELSTPTKDLRAEPLLKILPIRQQTTKDPKIAEIIALIKAKNTGDNDKAQVLLNSVIAELEALSNTRTTHTDKEDQVEKIIKNGLNKALVMKGGMSTVELFDNILKTQIPPKANSSRPKQ